MEGLRLDVLEDFLQVLGAKAEFFAAEVDQVWGERGGVGLGAGLEVENHAVGVQGVAVERQDRCHLVRPALFLPENKEYHRKYRLNAVMHGF